MVRIWDGPTRLFHWLLVALFAVSWWTAKHHAMDWHRLSGTILVGLLIFRLLWGVIGASTARFAGFVRGPRTVLAYVRGGGEGGIGHNPIGGYSVVAMLLLLVVQVTTGLFATDVDGIESGPLSALINFDQGRFAAHVHHLSFNILLGLIGLHVLAVAWYLVVRRRNLVGPMIVGRGAGDRDMAAAGWIRLVLAITAAGALAWWVSTGFVH